MTTGFNKISTESIFGAPPSSVTLIDNVFFPLKISGVFESGLRLSSDGTFCVRPDSSICTDDGNNLAFGTYNIALSITTVNVSIDIKPGSDPNSINLCSGGAVPIAILGSEGFFVSEVDTATLRFAEAAIKVVGKKDPHSLCSYEDVNDDWIEDLVCHFVTADIAAIDGESTSATLNGELLPEFGGTLIEGSDSINIVKDTC